MTTVFIGVELLRHLTLWKLDNGALNPVVNLLPRGSKLLFNAIVLLRKKILHKKSDENNSTHLL